jgi:WXXGXW repeat (2 copies)
MESAVLTTEKGVRMSLDAPYVLEEQMRHTILMAGISLLTISGSALAASPNPPNRADLAAPKVQLAQVQVQVPAAQPSPSATILTTPSSPPAAVVTTPGSQPSAAVITTPGAQASTVTTMPSANPASTTVVVAPTAPPPPQAENPPPAPGPSYVWSQGHWWWDGTQYVWKPGSYVMRPTTVAHWRPGYWQQGPNGWFWVDGSWN